MILPDLMCYFTYFSALVPEVFYCLFYATRYKVYWRFDTWHGFCSLFHIKITANVTKSSHQDCGPCYLHLPIFNFLYIHSPFLLENKKKVVVIAVFLSKSDHTSLFNCIYYKSFLVWGLVSIWLVNPSRCL